MRKIDHIVFCVHDLEAGVSMLEEKLGVKFSPGGRHLKEGTKNILLNLGDGCYLEVLAVDEENTDIPAPRWMGIDLLSHPQITRWALKTTEPQKDSAIVQAYNSEMGVIKGGQRITSSGAKLEWDLVMPLSTPEIEVIPFMTDWSKSDVHPTLSLPDICKVLDLTLTHPEPETVQPYLDQLVEGIDIKKGPSPAINITIQSPNGIVEL